MGQCNDSLHSGGEWGRVIPLSRDEICESQNSTAISAAWRNINHVIDHPHRYGKVSKLLKSLRETYLDAQYNARDNTFWMRSPITYNMYSHWYYSSLYVLIFRLSISDHRRRSGNTRWQRWQIDNLWRGRFAGLRRGRLR